jgi:photosystem II stability/assembly factor-like uncharacterized protein
MSGCARENSTAGTAPTAEPLCAFDAWTAVRRTTFPQITLSTMFADDSFGVAADIGGGINYTEDGGATWTYADKAGFSRVALDMAGRDMIWHIGYGGALRRSTDRARTWEYLSSLPYGGHVEYVSFDDAQTGWVVTTELNSFFVTRDGGKTWITRPLPDGMAFPAAIHLRTPTAGYLLDITGNLFASTDGGETWAKRSIGLAAGWTIPTLNHSAAMRFLDDRRGILALSVIGDGTGRVYGLRTLDGGTTWTEEAIAVPMGMFHLTRDGMYLTHVELTNQANITLLCSSGKPPT